MAPEPMIRPSINYRKSSPPLLFVNDGEGVDQDPLPGMVVTREATPVLFHRLGAHQAGLCPSPFCPLVSD